MSAAAAIGLVLTQAGSAPPAAAAECLVRKAPAGPLPVGEEPAAQFRAAISRTAALYLSMPRVTPGSNPNFSPDLFPVDRGYDEAVAMQGAYRLAHCILGAAHW